MARKGAMKWNSHSVFATPKHLAFRLPKKYRFPKLLTVICYLNRKSFLETVILLYCNAWCELALSKKTGTVLAKPIFPFQNQ